MNRDLKMNVKRALTVAVTGGSILFLAGCYDREYYSQSDTITLGGTQLTITSDLSIDASALADGITVSGGGLSRVFQVGAGTVSCFSSGRLFHTCCTTGSSGASS